MCIRDRTRVVVVHPSSVVVALRTFVHQRSRAKHAPILPRSLPNARVGVTRSAWMASERRRPAVVRETQQD
eukprot:11667-Pyramimonas_sp.AAC.1